MLCESNSRHRITIIVQHPEYSINQSIIEKEAYTIRGYRRSSSCTNASSYADVVASI